MFKTPKGQYQVINLTPHKVTLVGPSGESTYMPEPVPARVEMTQTPVGTLAGWPVMKTTYGRVIGLPEPQEGVWYIVSTIVKDHAKERTDLIVPDSGNAIRKDGQIVGVPGFII